MTKITGPPKNNGSEQERMMEKSKRDSLTFFHHALLV